MSTNDQTLQVEIIIDPARNRHRGQRRKGGPTAPDPARIPRITRLMALAVKFQDMVDRGEVRDYADLARLGCVSRARITQIMNLLNLAPQLQDNMILDPQQAAVISVSESQTRRISSLVVWQDQLDAWEQISGVPRRTIHSVSSRGGIHGRNAHIGSGSGTYLFKRESQDRYE